MHPGSESYGAMAGFPKEFLGKFTPEKPPKNEQNLTATQTLDPLTPEKWDSAVEKKGDSTLFSVRCFLTLGYRGEQDSTKKIHSRRDSWR